MKKIKSLFERNYDGDRQVRNEVVEGSEWVINGEGIATQKYDGTCCMIKNGIFYKRYTWKLGKNPTKIKLKPKDFIPATELDPITGKQEGWVPVTPEDKFHNEAFSDRMCDGTYELIGPKVQGNPENTSAHFLVMHNIAIPLPDCPRDFDGIKEFLKDKDIEGIVWHHPDGRMVKIKKKDFGMTR